MDVLELDRIGINDRFLDLGGDSLRATKILARTRGPFGVELSLRDLIRTETIAQMAELITKRHASGPGAPS
jgi:aryl carrier-like protein